jgi:hypothetical protein
MDLLSYHMDEDLIRVAQGFIHQVNGWAFMTVLTSHAV